MVRSDTGLEATVLACTVGASVTLLTSSTLTTSGSVTLYTPVRMKLQYAPTLVVGANNIFGDLLVTLERVRSGSLTCNFYNRRDLGDAAQQSFPIGEFLAGQGFTRTCVMPSLTSSENEIVYYDLQRFSTPIERSHDQQLVIELVSQTAFQPLAIKATEIDIISTGSTKAKQ